MKTEWDLTHLGDPKDFPKQREIWENKVKEFVSKWKDNKAYLESPTILKQALDDYEEYTKNFGSLGDEGFYYHLMLETNKDNSEIKAKYNNIVEFIIKSVNKMNFFELNLAKIPKEKQKEFLENEDLKEYKHHLEVLFKNAKYLLTEPEEKILNLKSQTSYSLWVEMLERFISREERELEDETGKKELRTYQEMMGLMKSQDKRIRDEAAKAFNKILEKYVDLAEEEINAIYLNKKINDELRVYKRPDQARHISDDIETEVVDTLIKTVSEDFDTAKEYYKLKAKLLKQDKLEYHERSVEYGKIDKKYTYEESIELIHKVFSKIDKKFSNILEQYIKNGQIDVFPKKGKRGGAFCTEMLKSQPTYILLNHTDKLNDVLTIAHELGHGINNELMREKQNSLYFDIPLVTAEVASTFMEDFVLQELLKEADEELKLALLMQRLDAEISTIYRQIACYLFEQELHKTFREHGHLSEEKIGEIFQKNMSSYMGKYVEQSKGSQNWWVFWSHIRAFFYVFSYSSGLLISKAMQNMVKENPKNIEKVKEFLSAGTSDSPKNIFLNLGIDITKKEFWESGLQEVRDLLKETEELAKKLGKI